jgi:hypothetical protein
MNEIIEFKMYLSASKNEGRITTKEYFFVEDLISKFEIFKEEATKG